MTDTSAQKKHTVLFVDDDPMFRELYGHKLTLAGYAVIVAHDGIEGLSLAQQQHPEIILSDVVMPNLNGLDMLKKLRESGEWGQRVPVIMLTNFNPDEAMNASITETTPTYYLIKGRVEPDEIIAKIAEVLSESH